LHFGSLVAALAGYCDARSRGGEWLVRIEDLDEPRSSRSVATGILEQLEAYGFRWDEPVAWQSERSVLYQAALDGLIARARAFPCVCTRKQLENAPLGAGGERIYPGTCRGGIPQGRSARAWRAAVPDEPTGFRDRLQGWIEQKLASEVGAFVLKRADGVFAYQLAVVVDDAEQRITHVVRGSDLLVSTPRQIWLQRELGLATPEYLHHPVAIDARGEKLSKQTLAAPLPRDPLPALMNAWAFLDQPMPASAPASVDAFWQWAHRAWDVRRLPPVSMLPASSSSMRAAV
jgi:glutamyl-Q tRNA(Asp) synthetase